MVIDFHRYAFYEKMKERVWKDFVKWYLGDYTDNDSYNAFQSIMDDINGEEANWRKSDAKIFDDKVKGIIASIKRGEELLTVRKKQEEVLKPRNENGT